MGRLRAQPRLRGVPPPALLIAIGAVGALIVGGVLGWTLMSTEESTESFDAASKPTSDSTSATDTTVAPSIETMPPPEQIAETRVRLTDLGIEESLSDIESVMAFAEGGDNPCSNDDVGGIRDAPTLVTGDFEENAAAQIGWDYALCWGFGIPADPYEMTDTRGATVEQYGYGAFPLLPGSPTGTYTVTTEYEGQTLTAEIEVVEATRSRLFVDPRSNRGDPLGQTDLTSNLELFLVGFDPNTTPPVAVYEGEAEYLPNPMIGSFEAEVDSDGAGRIVIEPASISEHRCISVLADPQAAIERWGYEYEDEAGNASMSLDIGQQLSVRACFEPT